VISAAEAQRSKNTYKRIPSSLLMCTTKKHIISTILLRFCIPALVIWARQLHQKSRPSKLRLPGALHRVEDDQVFRERFRVTTQATCVQLLPGDATALPSSAQHKVMIDCIERARSECRLIWVTAHPMA
jgi:hypothetical protein